MNHERKRATLKTVLEAAAEKLEDRKLSSLKEKLERALGRSCSEVECGDPMVIRRRLTEQMRVEGCSEGIVQSYEQLLMGVIRRAALKGLIPAPPEGPWTRRWQLVLATANDFQGTKLEIRALAAWASARGIEPEALNAEIIRQWANEGHRHKDVAVSKLEAVLAEHYHREISEDPASLLTNRLYEKAIRGSVRTSEQVYGKRHFENSLPNCQEGSAR